MTRRDAMRALGIWLNVSPLLRSQRSPDLAQRLPSMDELVNVLEFEPVAKRQLPVYNCDYIAGGVDDEWTLRRNREAFHWITLRPRMLRDVSKLDLSLTLFGQRLEMAILVAPTGGQGLAHSARRVGHGARRRSDEDHYGGQLELHLSDPADRSGGHRSGFSFILARISTPHVNT
jgi:hypothetical protein